jgi:CelD/BcsL family acetyltransferase involved in cellulose biosynthesis
LNGECIGVAYSLVDPAQRPNRTQYVYLTTHSVEHADLRAGTILLALLSERAASEGVETMDMLRGDEEYKKLWHVEPVPTYGVAMPRVVGERRLRSA